MLVSCVVVFTPVLFHQVGGVYLPGFSLLLFFGQLSRRFRLVDAGDFRGDDGNDLFFSLVALTLLYADGFGCITALVKIRPQPAQDHAAIELAVEGTVIPGHGPFENQLDIGHRKTGIAFQDKIGRQADLGHAHALLHVDKVQQLQDPGLDPGLGLSRSTVPADTCKARCLALEDLLNRIDTPELLQGQPGRPISY